jgi:nitrate reductase gamma subunit
VGIAIHKEVCLDTLYYVILIPMVYVAVAVFIIGTAIRLVKIFREPKHPSTLQIFPSPKSGWPGLLVDVLLFPTVRRHKPVLWVFLMLFHIALVLLIIGHLELIAEFGVFQIISHEVFLGNGWVGITLCVTLLYFLFRRFGSPVKELSVPEDFLLLILLLLIVIFGSEMDWARRWYGYEELMVEDYREYLRNLLTLNLELPYNLTAAGHSFMLVLHVFFANLFLMFFPFSQLMHSFLALPVNKLRRG